MLIRDLKFPEFVAVKDLEHSSDTRTQPKSIISGTSEIDDTQACPLKDKKPILKNDNSFESDFRA